MSECVKGLSAVGSELVAGVEKRNPSKGGWEMGGGQAGVGGSGAWGCLSGCLGLSHSALLLSEAHGGRNKEPLPTLDALTHSPWRRAGKPESLNPVTETETVPRASLHQPEPSLVQVWGYLFPTLSKPHNPGLPRC